MDLSEEENEKKKEEDEDSEEKPLLPPEVFKHLKTAAAVEKKEEKPVTGIHDLITELSVKPHCTFPLVIFLSVDFIQSPVLSFVDEVEKKPKYDTEEEDYRVSYWLFYGLWQFLSYKSKNTKLP